MKKEEPKENILIEANRIISGDRKAQYGDQRLNFRKYGRIATELLNEEENEAMKRGEITDTIVAKVMLSIKLGRESFKHKRDNLTDLCGYSSILNDLQD